jgi:outer membrane protein assembly factor BamB
MNLSSSIKYPMHNNLLFYDYKKALLLCKSNNMKEDLWMKKLNSSCTIDNIIEDSKRFYINCTSNETSGEFIAVNIKTGKNEWIIPGKSFFEKIYEGDLFLIFIDENNLYFLIKVDCDTGEKIWHFLVEDDLIKYIFSDNKLELIFKSGKTNVLSIYTGKKIY